MLSIPILIFGSLCRRFLGRVVVVVEVVVGVPLVGVTVADSLLGKIEASKLRLRLAVAVVVAAAIVVVRVCGSEWRGSGEPVSTGTKTI